MNNLQRSEQYPLRRRTVVKQLLDAMPEALVITGLGATAWDVTAAGDSPRQFPLWGAMGGAAMIGLGLALAQPQHRVLVITGDGELLTIRFRAAGAAGATSELALEQLLAADDATREMLVTAEQGQITVRPANPGLLDVLIGLLVLGGIVFLVWQLMRRRTARSPRPPLAPEPAPAPSARTDAEPADSVSRE